MFEAEVDVEEVIADVVDGLVFVEATLTVGALGDVLLCADCEDLGAGLGRS